jgi:hypothetical protein
MFLTRGNLNDEICEKRISFQEEVTWGFFFISWGGVRLSLLGMSATNWPIVPSPDDR